jgi:hypothetical protein
LRCVGPSRVAPRCSVWGYQRGPTGKDVGVGLSEADAVDMLRTISDGVYVRSLAAKDRSLVFAIVRKLVERAGLAALDAEVDLAEMMVVSMDGEKDPGCLLDAFHAAQSVLRLFSGLESRGGWGCGDGGNERACGHDEERGG